MLKKSPSFKILIFAALGFIFQKFYSFELYNLVVFTIYLLVFALVISAIWQNRLPIFVALAFLLGISISIRTNNLDYVENQKCNRNINGFFYANVSKILKSTPKYSRLIIEGKFLDDKWKLTKNSRVLLTIVNSKKRSYYHRIDENDQVTGLFSLRFPNKANLPNEFNEVNYLRNLDCDFTAFGFANKIALVSINKPPSTREIVKKALYQKIDHLYSKKTRGIVKAILLGDKSELHRETRKEFAVTGVAHILAVSGFHVGIIAGILFWLFSFLRNEYIKFLLIVASLAFYIYLVDFQPSAIRAGIMIVLFLFALLIQRKPNPLNIIATTVLLIAVFHPQSLYSIGFQMSIAAISGIFLLFTPLNNFFNNTLKFDKTEITKVIGSSLSVSLAASLVVSPLVAYYFGIYSIISPLANLVVIPFMFLGQIFGIVSLFSSFIFMPMGHIFANTSQLAIEIAMVITHYAAKLPFSHISGEQTIWISILTSFILIYLILAGNLQKFKFRLSIVFVLLALFVAKTSLHLDKSPIKVYERSNCYLIVNHSQKTNLLIGKKNCNSDWDDYGLTKYLSTNKKRLFLYNIPKQYRYSLYKSKIKYKRLFRYEEVVKLVK